MQTFVSGSNAASSAGSARGQSLTVLHLLAVLDVFRLLLGLRDNPTEDCGEVNALLDAHIRRVEVRVEALLQLKQHLLNLREKCSGARPVEACGILQGLSDCNCPSSISSKTSR